MKKFQRQLHLIVFFSKFGQRRVVVISEYVISRYANNDGSTEKNQKEEKRFSAWASVQAKGELMSKYHLEINDRVVGNRGGIMFRDT